MMIIVVVMLSSSCGHPRLSTDGRATGTAHPGRSADRYHRRHSCRWQRRKTLRRRRGKRAFLLPLLFGCCGTTEQRRQWRPHQCPGVTAEAPCRSIRCRARRGTAPGDGIVSVSGTCASDFPATSHPAESGHSGRLFIPIDDTLSTLINFPEHTILRQDVLECRRRATECTLLPWIIIHNPFEFKSK